MRMAHDSQKTALVVMEAGARWPSYSREISGRASSAVVESQPPSESFQDFASRVVARVDKLSAGAAEVPVAIVAVGQRIDLEARAARYRIARSLLSLMLAHGEGELLILGDAHYADEVRHELVAFAGALCDGLGGSRVSVRVRFGDARLSRPDRRVAPARVASG